MDMDMDMDMDGVVHVRIMLRREDSVFKAL